MSAALHLARPEDLIRLANLVAARRGDKDAETLYPALAPLLDDNPLGCAYLIGPARAPLEYILLGFGWSVELGGVVGRIDDLFIRPAIRRRGIAGEVLVYLPKALAGAGLVALDLEAVDGADSIESVAARCGFRTVAPGLRMMRML